MKEQRTKNKEQNLYICWNNACYMLIDKQTTNDLELFERVKGEKSVFSLFNYTKSSGGKKRLETIFRNPLSNIDTIQKRIEIIRYFQGSQGDLEVDRKSLDFIEHYLIQQNVPNRFSVSNSFLKAFIYGINPKNEYYIIQRGVRVVIELLNAMYDYAIVSSSENSTAFIHDCKEIIKDKIKSTSLKTALGFKNRKKIYPHELGKLDYLFRKKELNSLKELLDIVYEFEVFKSVAFASHQHGFGLPVFTKETRCFKVEGVFHPFIDHPVKNDFKFIPESPLCFLTGPNMAGKSTFLKALSISLYLSHLGFPVPAQHMETSLYNGLLTTINLSDNLSKGYSHFYNEVIRVKYVAERINEVGNIFVVFDELFRGTNVKDAYEASLAVISAFSRINNGVFAISTHIIEIADKLCDNNSIFFKNFEATIVNEIPQYNYKIKDGITDERIGMYILKKENVIETIENTIATRNNSFHE